MKRFLKYSVCFLLVGMIIGSAIGQDDPKDDYLNSKITKRSFDKKNWEKTVSGIDYSNGKEKERARDKSNNQELGESNEPIELSDDLKISPFWSTFIKFIFISILAIMLALLIYQILKGENIFKRSKKITTTTTFDLEKVEENIHESDLDRFIQQAENDGNYNLAIRLFYLAIIKELSLGKLIKWKRNKTNRAYLQELGTHSFASEFKKATPIFEQIWYGDRMLDQQNYLILKPQFQQWINEIRKIQTVQIT